ncbi:syntaxin, putative [Ixodes scapularis]|uniref:Syntaxin, putative n=1 Tax=Ixodes scapularis TaxID=6945 RepID=B7PDN0_IXOSC|nr:syntaxin, putative [Ixodes scapularis]|eukprot:XP_002410966.1 syntaxin, putative [Ixodes scapularis]
MATRSLTEAFILMRNNALQSKHIFGEQVQEDTVALVGQDVERGFGIYKDASEPPRWVDALEEVRFLLIYLFSLVKDLSALHDRHLNRPTFDESSLEEDEIEQATHELTQLFSHCQQLLSVIQQGGRHGSNLKEASLAQNVVRSVAGSLQSLTTTFRSSQTTYCKRLQSREEHSNKFFDVPFYSEETRLAGTNWYFNRNSLDDAIQQSLKKSVTSFFFNICYYVYTYKLGIGEIKFRRIGHCFVFFQQGTVLDRIDYNLDNVQTRVQQGLQQLQKADTFQKKNHKMMCILVMAASTIILIVLLFVLKF